MNILEDIATEVAREGYSRCRVCDWAEDGPLAVPAAKEHARVARHTVSVISIATTTVHRIEVIA